MYAATRLAVEKSRTARFTNSRPRTARGYVPRTAYVETTPTKRTVLILNRPPANRVAAYMESGPKSSNYHTDYIT